MKELHGVGEGTSSDAVIARFGPFTLRLDTEELRRDGEPVALAPKASRVLAVLVRGAGTLVSRETLYQAAWGATVVEFDQALNTSVRQVRATLGDDARAPTFIDTVPRRGYRFRHPVVFEEAPGRTVVSARRKTHRTARAVATRASRWTAAAMALFLAWSVGRSGERGAPPSALGALAVDFDVSGVSPAAAPVGAALEEAVLGQWGRGAGRPGGSGRAAVLVTGSLLPADDGVRLHALVVRTSDGSVVWTGTFNPYCPDAADPVAVIGYHLADQARRAGSPRT